MTDAVAVIGALASVVGAAIAAWQAGRAHSAKRSAESAIRSIQNRDIIPVVQKGLGVLDELEAITVFFRGLSSEKPLKQVDVARNCSNARHRVQRLYELLRDLPGGGLEFPVSRETFYALIDELQSQSTGREHARVALKLAAPIRDSEQWLVNRKESAMAALSESSTNRS